MKSLITLLALAALAIAAGAALAGDGSVVYRHHWSLPASPGGAVRLDLATQDARMHVAPGTQVEVAVTIYGDTDDKQDLIKRYKPIVKTEDGDVVIKALEQDDGHGFSFGDDSRALVEVALPAGMAVRFKLDTGDFDFDGAHDRASLTGRVDTGDISINTASRKLDLHSDTGDVEVTLNQPANRVSIDTDTGDVRLEGVAKRINVGADTGNIVALGQFGEARLKADTGDIRVTGLSGSLKAETDTGDISARWRTLASAARIDIGTDLGDVTLILPDGAGLNGEVKTDGGDIHSDFHGDYNEDHDLLRLTGGDIAVHVSADGGDIALRQGE